MYKISNPFPFSKGNVIEAKNRPGLTYEIMETSQTDATLKKLTCDGLRRGIRNIGDVFNVQLAQFSFSNFRVISVQVEIPVSNVVEFAKPLNACGCDCGGFAVYRSEASHCHSSWCFVNRKAV